MLFSHAKAKAQREDSMRRGELASPASLSPDVLGGSGGEVVGGSGGGFGDFLMPGGGAASVVGSAVDSVEIEEVFSEFDHQDGGGVRPGIKTKEGAVKLIFPIYNQDNGEVGEQWLWNVCWIDWRASWQQVLHQTCWGFPMPSLWSRVSRCSQS
jgi:hypothetical protein